MAIEGTGHKANERKLAKFGLSELKRAGQQAVWTKQYGRSPGNPHRRDKVYPEVERVRWARFDDWDRKNADRSVWDNPYRRPDWHQINDPASAAHRLIEAANEAEPATAPAAQPCAREAERPDEASEGDGLPPNDDGAEDALDDLGVGSPVDRAKTTGYRYKRDTAVRNKVKKRAKGRCEYCEKPSFLDTDGEPYLECHHIISLADQGADKPWNVIALCPEHRTPPRGPFRTAGG